MCASVLFQDNEKINININPVTTSKWFFTFDQKGKCLLPQSFYNITFEVFP